jgi:LacI family transcriptional regulator
MNPKQKPSNNIVKLSDIAAYCNLSISTVSRVLSGNSGNFKISEETIHKVSDVAKKLNYRPNRLARAIKSRRTHLIGLSLPHYTEDDFSDEMTFANEHRVIGLLFSSIQKHPCFKNYDLVIHHRNEQPNSKDIFNADLIDGLIYALPSINCTELIKQIQSQIPVVILGDTPTLHKQAVCVDMNNRKMAEAATRYLLSTGRKKILLLIPESVPAFCIQDRILGYREAIASAGLPENPDLVRVLKCDPDFLAQYIQSSDTFAHIDAVFGLTDEMASFCINPLKKRGFRIPEDISIMGFSGHNLFTQTNPPLSTVKTPFGKMAYTAIDMLIDVLDHNRPYTPGFYEVPAEIIIKGSTV